MPEAPPALHLDLVSDAPPYDAFLGGAIILGLRDRPGRGRWPVPRPGGWPERRPSGLARRPPWHRRNERIWTFYADPLGPALRGPGPSRVPCGWSGNSSSPSPPTHSGDVGGGEELAGCWLPGAERSECVRTGGAGSSKAGHASAAEGAACKGRGDCLLLDFSVLRPVLADKSASYVAVMFACLSL